MGGVGIGQGLRFTVGVGMGVEVEAGGGASEGGAAGIGVPPGVGVVVAAGVSTGVEPAAGGSAGAWYEPLPLPPGSANDVTAGRGRLLAWAMESLSGVGVAVGRGVPEAAAAVDFGVVWEWASSRVAEGAGVMSAEVGREASALEFM